MFQVLGERQSEDVLGLSYFLQQDPVSQANHSFWTVGLQPGPIIH